MKAPSLPRLLALAATAAVPLEASGAEPTETAQVRQLPSALHFGATIYATNAAVALRADRGCWGALCSERYFSLVPVLGGLAQLSHAGFDFHDVHHGKLCVPLTFGAVGGQLLALGAQAGGLELDVDGPAGGRFQLAIVSYQDESTAAGLGIEWVQ